MRFLRKIRLIFSGSWLMARLLLSIESTRFYWRGFLFPAGIQQVVFFRQDFPQVHWIYDAPFVYGLYFNAGDKRVTLRRVSKVNRN